MEKGRAGHVGSPLLLAFDDKTIFPLTMAERIRYGFDLQCM